MILPARMLLRRAPLITRFSIPHICPRKFSIQPLRRSSIRSNNAPSVPHKSTRKLVFPERLLIYHAGTGRSVFLGCLRVTTIFIFSFFCLVVAPTHWYAEEQKPWATVAGVVPLVFVSYISSPFVANIHVRLPSFARYSSDILQRYTQTLPKDAQLDITTMNFFGRPRISAVRMGDIRRVKERFGMVNYVRDTKETNPKRPWWMGNAVKRFGVHGGVGLKGPNAGVWENIAKTIARR